ncbi:IS1634 family transposase [Streptomyces sp. NPDC056149]|uniref:IS1634 family transposase n=1 Tax=Streptomyces sp. NPDC056149 TaxID=3345728 RepID=UPI0035D6430B
MAVISGQPRRRAWRGRAELVVPRVAAKRLAALPVVADFCRRLDIAGIIDRLCPVRDVARVSHGEVVEALIANRLTAPAPLQHIAAWADEWAVEEVFGIEAETLNDDRIARALDAIAPELEHITGSVGAAAITAFGLDVSRLHWDMTSISVHGAFDDIDENFPAPRWGRPKDRRPDLKQVQTGLAVTGDGGIPVFHRAYDGGAAEVAQVTAAMTALKDIAAERDFLLVGDSKLISHSNVAAMTAAGVSFVAPLAKSLCPTELFVSLDPAQADPVDYTADRDTSKPPQERAGYRVREDTMTLAGRRKSDPALPVRRVLVHSTANAVAQQAARTRRLAKAAEDLDTLARTAGTRHRPTIEAVAKRAAEILRARKVHAIVRTRITTNPDTGKPAFTWHFDQQALETEAAADGWYALLTNLDPAQADAAEVLIRYKGQQVVERRYSDFKGPLAVAPMFLKRNRRIASLVTVICLALLIFCLVERQVRQALGPERELRGFHTDNRASRPTGRLIFTALGRLQLIPGTSTDPPQVPLPQGIQARLLQLLNVDPTRPRYLASSIPTCEERD